MKRPRQRRVDTPTAVFTGELVIKGDLITCVAVDCVEPAGTSIFTVTDGCIYPWFVDAHNHVAYNGHSTP